MLYYKAQRVFDKTKKILEKIRLPTIVCQKRGRHYAALAVVSLISFSYQGDGILIGNKCYLRQ